MAVVTKTSESTMTRLLCLTSYAENSGFGYAHSISMYINIGLFTPYSQRICIRTQNYPAEGGFEPLPFDYQVESATGWDSGEDMKETQIKASMVTIYRRYHTITNEACHKKYQTNRPGSCCLWPVGLCI